MLPYGRHSLDEDDIAAVVRVLREAPLTTGPAVERFEAALARAVGASEAVACSSGTAALHLAAMGLDVGPGDVAVVPALTFTATAACARLAGAGVVIADVDPDTGLMGPEHLAAALARARRLGRPRLALPVHLNGQAADMPALAEVAAAAEVTLIEDACHALGTLAGNDRIGACRHSAMAAFSFHPVKTVAMGEGGAVTTNDAALAQRLRRLRSHGITRAPEDFLHPEAALAPDGRPHPWYYEVQEIGFNYRASDIHCALGLSQLGKLERFVARRRHLARLYDEALAPLAPVVRPVARLPGCQAAWHLYVVLIDFEAAGTSRDAVMRRLAEDGIGSQVHYVPLHLHPAYGRHHDGAPLPGADAYYRRCLSLPLFPAMADDDVARVVAGLRTAVAGGAA